LLWPDPILSVCSTAARRYFPVHGIFGYTHTGWFSYCQAARLRQTDSVGTRITNQQVWSCLIRVASYCQIIVCHWLILACSGSFRKHDLLRAKEKPSD